MAAMCASVMLGFILAQPAPAATAKSSTKKGSTAAKSKKAPTEDSDAAPAAPKKSSGNPLDLPLPVKVPATPVPAVKKSDESATSSDKPPEKPGSESPQKREHAPNATVEPETIAEFASQPPRIQQLIRDAIDLTRLNLTYAFGSADPDTGGMDCSGTIYYLLHAHGFNDVARDSSGQYLWARKSGAFFPVVSKSAESVELNDLLPGDLMFWIGTYDTGRDVPISHVMLYLGREKGTGKRIMFGASDGRSYNGVQRWGVSVFDFKMPKADPEHSEKVKAEFVGFARIPGLRTGITPIAETVAASTATPDAAKPAPKPTPASFKKKKGATRKSE